MTVEAFLEDFPVFSAQKVATSTTLDSFMGTVAAGALPIPAATDPVSRLASTVMALYQNLFFTPTQQGVAKLTQGGEVLVPTSLEYGMTDASGAAGVAVERPGGC